MVPAGEPTNSTITTLAGMFESGDVIIDGGNSNYKETAPLVDAAGRPRGSPWSTPAPPEASGGSRRATA